MISNDIGKIIISQDVIKQIIEETLKEIKGVKGIYKQEKTAFFKKNYGESLEVEMSDSECVVDMQISLIYGENIVEISNKIQEVVKENIEKLTDIRVKEINILVVSYEKKVIEGETNE